MTVLTLNLPRLKSGEHPVEFLHIERRERSSWCSELTVARQGLAYYQRVGLITQIRGEEGRFFQAENDPRSVTGLWLSDGSDHDDDQKSVQSSSEDALSEGSYQQASAQRKRFVHISEEDLMVNWYDVLKLEKQEDASDEQIRQAYKRRCLETHPDKQQDRSDELFKKVQRAFDILGDPETRRSYDSSRPFDDSIPEAVVEESMFYRTFASVFDRNKKWSCKKDLPSLGDDQTPYASVMRFYDQWGMYQSWRDFAHIAELAEIDDSMGREERRYYMRQNERQLAQLHREELKRIRTLVERARKNDPRLRRKREADEAKRRKEQEDREAFREKLRAEQERQQRREEEKERERQQDVVRAAQAQKDAVRQAQKELLEFLQAHELIDKTPTNKILSNAVRKPNITWLFSKLTDAQEARSVLERVRSASTTRVPKHAAQPEPAIDDEDELGDEVVEAVRVLNRFIYERERLVGMNRYGEPIKKVVYGDKEPIAGATASSGAGTSNGGNKSQPQQGAVVWTAQDLARLQKATAKYPPGTIERWSKILVALHNRFTQEQAISKVNELNASLNKDNGSRHAGSAAPAATPTPSVDDWTVKQQKQLEQGLRELKEYKEKDKFQKIGAMVEGKTAKECFDRYKYLSSLRRKS